MLLESNTHVQLSNIGRLRRASYGSHCENRIGRRLQPLITAHQAIPEALSVSARRLGVTAKADWIHTSSIDAIHPELTGYVGLWCVPASPYANADGALAAIKFARQSSVPFLGTCGGFQHAILEYARNVLGYANAEHAETSPEALLPLIAPLSCSLVEKSDTVRLVDGTLLQAIYGQQEVSEGYHCRYGLNREYEAWFAAPSELRVAARDEAGEVRAVELVNHPFFVGTLYQPERSGLKGVEHPLVTAFVSAARHKGGMP